MTSTLLTETESVIVTRDGAPRTLVSSVERVVVRDEAQETVHREVASLVIAEGAPADLDDFAGEGTRGLVPDPGAGDDDRVLRADGTWGAQSGGGGGGAPTDAQYIVAALNASLSAERLLSGESGVVSLDFATPGAAVVSIVAGGVANAKLGSMAEATLKGRAAGTGTGAPIDLTASQARTLLNVENGATADQVASEVPFTPTGAVAATNVQSAIAELDTEKAPVVHSHAIADVTGLQTALDAKLEAPVANASLADMANATIKGRATSGTGDPEDLSASQVRTILNVADGANAYTHPNHTGDVTSSGDGATTIAANAVTNAKLAQIATATVKARTTAGTGNVEDVSVAALAELFGDVQTLRFGTNQSFTSTTFAILLDWDDSRLDPDWATYDAATGEFTIVQDSHVKIDATISLVLNAAGNGQFQLEIAQETSPGVYTRLNDFLVTQDVATTRDGASNAQMHVAWAARAGEVFVLRGRRSSGTAQIDTKLAWSWLTIDTRLTP